MTVELRSDQGLNSVTVKDVDLIYEEYLPMIFGDDFGKVRNKKKNKVTDRIPLQLFLSPK